MVYVEDMGVQDGWCLRRASSLGRFAKATLGALLLACGCCAIVCCRSYILKHEDSLIRRCGAPHLLNIHITFIYFSNSRHISALYEAFFFIVNENIFRDLFSP